MRSMLVLLAVLTWATLAPAAGPVTDPICGPARQAECDPKLADCLRDHPEETKIAACMQRYRQCGERLRMSPAKCSEVAAHLAIAPGLGVVPEGAPVR